MFGKKVLNELSAYQQGKQTSEVQEEFNLDRIVKLASNENPHRFTDKLNSFFANLEADFEIYPDGYAYELKKSVAKKLAVDESQLVFGSGSDEVITFICRAFLYDGVNTIMAKPTFSQYRHHALIEGAEIIQVPTINGQHDLKGMVDAITDDTKVVWICSPDNPTGEIVTRDMFDQFMLACPKDVIVVLDEAYVEYVDENIKLNLNENLTKYDNLIVLRTFSKAYGLAGLRVGYGVAKADIAEKLNIVRGPFNTSSFSQRAATIAIEDEAFIKRTKKVNDEIRHIFETFLDTIKWDYYKSHTNFLLVKTPISAEDVSHYLLTKGYIVRSGDMIGYPDTVRITIGKQDDMRQLQEILFELNEKIIDGVL